MVPPLSPFGGRGLNQPFGKKCYLCSYINRNNYADIIHFIWNALSILRSIPAHIHVIKGNATAKFIIDPEITLIENRGFKPQELKLAESVIEENRELIALNWKQYFGK